MITRFFSLLIVNLLYVSCDQDYVNSLNSTNPKISMELLTNLDDNYLGESIENIEILVKVKDSPSISSLAFSVNYQPAFFIRFLFYQNSDRTTPVVAIQLDFAKVHLKCHQIFQSQFPQSCHYQFLRDEHCIDD